jgi:hypothetical protein
MSPVYHPAPAVAWPFKEKISITIDNAVSLK